MRTLVLLLVLCAGSVLGQGTGTGTGTGTGNGTTGTTAPGTGTGTGGGTLPDQRCTLRCRSNQPPQCAVFNQVYRLFRSSCARRAHSCSNRENWQVVSMRLCGRFVCPLVCSNRRNSICGTNGRRFLRFRNRCTFLNYACRSTRTWRPSSARNCAVRIRLRG